jgi:hypothetical protein
MMYQSIFHKMDRPTMQLNFRLSFVLALLLLVNFLQVPAVLALDTVSSISTIRQRGQSVPPFLNPGVKPNLLLLLDNSGSMLDMAYTDEDIDGDGDENPDTANYCQDATFNTPEQEYTGYFEQDLWYKWEDSGVAYWKPGELYNNGTLVYDNGIVYQAVCSGGGASCTASTTPIKDDLGNGPIVWNPVTGEYLAAHDFTFDNGKLFQNGTPVDEGAFVVVSDGTQCDDTEYQNSDVCIKMIETSTPREVTKFAATGKFLNWLSASKFDIQKKILTGGKYNTEADLLVSEHRGCAGSSFLKEIVVSSGATKKLLSFRIKGPVGDSPLEYENDKIADTDNTTRIAILGLTEVEDDQASVLSEDCQKAIDGIMAGDNLNSLSNPINGCLTPLRTAENPELTDQRPVLNHALQLCQKYFNDGERDLNTIINECEKLYEGTPAYLPADINPYYGAYLCYGIYDADVVAADRSGFVGRCWDPGSAGSCKPKPATDGCTLGATATSCTYEDGGGLYRNYRESTSSPTYNWVCTSVKKDGTCQNDSKWKLLYTDGTQTYDEPTCGSSTASSGAGWVPSDDEEACIRPAANDYCDSLRVTEVIDPSDQASTTSDFWNAPATLIDSGIIVAFGTDRPVAVLKGHIRKDTVPAGVLQRHAKDLRIGAMKINAVGSEYECSLAQTGNTIQKFCPSTGNRDGARLIAPLQLGGFVVDEALEKTHVQAVAEAINEVQADTWTPLAEAVFSAIGYYTQREDMRLNEGDFPVSAADDPVQFSCQDNHLLVITEGASTKDIADTVADFVADLPDSGGEIGGCNALQGSTYLDNLTGFGYYDKPAPEEFLLESEYNTAYAAAEAEATLLYGSLAAATIDGDLKEGITTHIITTGSLRTEGEGQCSPATLIKQAGLQGGSKQAEGYINGEDPGALENGLISVIESIIERASTGSSASVISSSRSGEGGVYQAIFWPETKWTDEAGEEHMVQWYGDVHALFIDANGYLYEDTNRNGRMEPLRDLNNNGVCDTLDEDLDDDGQLDLADEDVNNNGLLDANEDLDLDGNLDRNEDTNGNGVLDVAEQCWANEAAKGYDRRVVIYYDVEKDRSVGCYAFEYVTNENTGLRTLQCTSSVDLEDINYIWAANDWLAAIPDTLLAANRATFIAETRQRYIFTWNDLNNDGIADENEMLPFQESTNWANAAVTNGRGRVPYDFGMKGLTTANAVIGDADVDAIVNWMRGRDSEGFRSRLAEDGSYKRLGDVIHSTPMVVSSPQEAYDLLYNDYSYSEFAAVHDKRRHVVYFGANDGMFHAVNGGFYDDEKKMFCRTKECKIDETTGKEAVTAGTPELGAELWAYVPYNLQPHLEFLSNPNYLHKYYVDLRPRIFDAQIFSPDTMHPNGWGTILVGGMRFGGAPVHAKELNGLATDNRVFASSYFVFDITDPEQPPKLLGEITRTSEDVNFDGLLASTGEDDNSSGTLDGEGTDLGYSTAIPTLVIMKKDGATVGTEQNKWYLLLGSGPHAKYTTNDPYGARALKGFSDQNAKVAVVPLDRAVHPSRLKEPLRIPDVDMTETATFDPATEGGRFVLDASKNGFVSDLITVDFDIGSSLGDYMSDAVYFGTVEARENSITVINGGFSYATDGTATWDGGGKLYRLVTRSRVGTDNDYAFVPPSKLFNLTGSYAQLLTTPQDWTASILMNPERPITGAPSVSYDGSNFWVYFGTGRFYDEDDKTDITQQGFFGIKEPKVGFLTTETDTIEKFTWATVEKTGTPTSASGAKGLVFVDGVLVQDATSAETAALTCREGATCLPAGITDATGASTFDRLVEYIAGTGECTASTSSNCADGWYKEFYPPNNRERNLGQASILGGLVTFTTYQPYDDPCQPEGKSYLYGVHYQTGTAWYENIFGRAGLDELGNVREKLELGRGLSTTPSLHAGGGGGVTAFVQTSTGEIREIEQKNLPMKNYFSGRERWQETQCF